MEKSELDRLERLAGNATSGPWISTGAYVWSTKGNGAIDMPLTHGGDAEMYKQDADYIAAASPDVILSILRALKITQRALEMAASNDTHTAKDYIKAAERELYPEQEQG